MKSISITKENRLVFYVDRGLGKARKVKGKFQIRSEDGVVEDFTGIYQAMIYYFNLEKSAKFWSLNSRPKLFHEKLVFEDWQILKKSNELHMSGKI